MSSSRSACRRRRHPFTCSWVLVVWQWPRRHVAGAAGGRPGLLGTAPLVLPAWAAGPASLGTLPLCCNWAYAGRNSLASLRPSLGAPRPSPCDCFTSVPAILPPPQDYEGGEFSLFFANCEPNSEVYFDAKVALYNVKGSKNDFLPVGDDVLPIIYFVSRLPAGCGCCACVPLRRLGSGSLLRAAAAAAALLPCTLSLLKMANPGPRGVGSCQRQQWQSESAAAAAPAALTTSGSGRCGTVGP